MLFGRKERIMDDLISRISLKQSIAASAILKDKKTLEQIIDEEPSADNDSLYKMLNEAHNEGYDVGYWAGRRDYEQKWIPCSERLPEEKDAGILKKLGTNKRSDDVIATVDVKGERMTVTACTHDGKWDWNMKYAFPDFKVVAWMPLPKPYKGEE